MSKRPTIQDVADRAGVSRSAISKVLRNAYGISDDMRSRVEAAIAEEEEAASALGGGVGLGEMLRRKAAAEEEEEQRRRRQQEGGEEEPLRLYRKEGWMSGKGGSEKDLGNYQGK